MKNKMQGREELKVNETLHPSLTGLQSPFGSVSGNFDLCLFGIWESGLRDENASECLKETVTLKNCTSGVSNSHEAVGKVHCVSSFQGRSTW
jgi:hypothetical protein